MKVLSGGCFCKFIRYEVRGEPFYETCCHCTICRRTSAAPLVAWFTVRPSELVYLSGEPTTFSSSEHGTRNFCPRCGTHVAFWSTRFPDEVDVATCTLDDPDAVPPRDHTQTGTQLSWLQLDDGLPRFPGARY